MPGRRRRRDPARATSRRPDRRDAAVTRRPPGHDPRARPDRAARPRQGARRAARRRRGARRAAGAAHGAPGRSPSGRSRPRILVTNDDGVESRGLLALKQALEPIGDVTVVAPGHEPERGRPPEDADAAAARPRADPRRRLARLLGRRLADRRRQPRVPRLLRARLRPRRVGHQLRREPRRRHHVLGHGQRGDGGGHQQLPGVRDLAGVLRASRLRARRPWPRRPSRATSSSTACRPASSSTSTCRP